MWRVVAIIFISSTKEKASSAGMKGDVLTKLENIS